MTDFDRVRFVHRGSLLLILMLALAASAISQEIVIEPTNGRAETRNHVPRPAESSPVAAKHSSAKSANQPTKRVPAKQIATRSKSPVQTSPAVSILPEAETKQASAVPVPKKVPARPEWAMSTTRDAHSLQTEITNALARDSKLAGSSVTVRVDDESVTLEGRAPGTEERLQAQRLARSYAWDRKLVDHIEVAPMVSVQK
jgi:hypothetical protein